MYTFVIFLILVSHVLKIQCQQGISCALVIEFFRWSVVLLSLWLLFSGQIVRLMTNNVGSKHWSIVQRS